MRRDTIIQHIGEEKKFEGAVAPGICQTSLFVFEQAADLRSMTADPASIPGKYVYSPMGNPTLATAEAKIAALEGTESALLFASGMGAISAALFSCLKAGDHIVCVDTCYGPTHAMLADYLPRFGVETTFVVGEDPEDFVRATRPNTRVFYLESPSSILFRFQDFRAITDFAKSRGIKTITDNSYASPIFQQPHSMGVDIVVHSATKYIAGHSDVVAGALCGDKATCDRIVNEEARVMGNRIAPFEAWLITRGLRTLRLRAEEAQRTGNALASFLKSREEVRMVFHAGDEHHPQHALYEAQMQGSTGLVTFMPKFQQQEDVYRFLESLKIFQIGVSWGGFESLAVPIYSTPMDWPEPKWLIRLYGGLEDNEDLIEDLDQAFRAVGARHATS